MKKIVLALCLLGTCLLGAGFAHAQVKNGASAPDFTLPGEDGKAHSLKDSKGKIVVLEWYNEGCPYVKKHYNSGNMQGLQKEFTGKDVVWYSIISSKEGSQGAMEDAKSAAKLKVDSKSFSTHILLDQDSKVGRLYGAKTTPHMFVIDGAGKVAYQGAIDDKPSASKKTLTGAKNYVRTALEEVMAGKKVSMAETQPYGCAVKY